MLRKLKVSDLRAVLIQYRKEEVTFSKMVELLNERSAYPYLPMMKALYFQKNNY